MKTLDQIPPAWSQKLPASERFVLVLDGEGVLDKETGLVWEKSPDSTLFTWLNAVDHCIELNVGGRKGLHIPTIEQLASVVDPTQNNPSLPSGHPFTFTFVPTYFWSSTTSANSASMAKAVYFYDGTIINGGKTVNMMRVWCVRGGQSHDAY